MINQEIYDKVRKHLLTQNKKALNPEGTRCRYRATSDGARCAIGCLIPDELYSLNMEGEGVSPGFIDKYHLNDLFPVESFGLLRSLQATHDLNYPCHWKECLDIIANAYNLEVHE